MKRAFQIFVGIDLGGARGKTTAVSVIALESRASGQPEAVVREVSTRRGDDPWHDDALFAYLSQLGEPAVIAINAPLTAPACVRCELDACPGKEVCTVPAVVWLRSRGQDMVSRAVESDRDRVVAIPGSVRRGSRSPVSARSGPRIEPYVHRACEVVMHYEQGLLRRGALGMANSPIGARASHVRRRLGGLGFQLNRDLIEVRARATVHALFGERHAHGYRRDADPWGIRASIIEGLSDLRFGPASRMAREDVLSNDHCFDALISSYTAYLWARDGWELPEPVFQADGWIWAPEPD